MTGFIGRRKELRVLEDAFAGPRSALVPIYGRRRVGKSELILRFLEGKRGVYYLGKKAPAGLQMREFLEEAAAALGQAWLADFATDSWGAALDAVASHWNSPEKLVLVFDEIQWIVDASPELPSVLQEKWDRRWSRSGQVLLILCGSYVGFMEREILGRRSPLFGRRTAQILLRPFDYRESAAFHPGYSLTDRAKSYFICGGIPFYLRFFSDRRSVESNIRRELLDEHAPLYREGEFLLREELREVESYYAILLSIASGHTSNRAISRHSGIESRRLPYYLHQLLELSYLGKRYPLSDEKRSARYVRYELGDPLLRFWFRFVFPNMSYLLHMGPERAWADRIRPHLDAYFGHCFERLCREALPHLYRREGVTADFEVGEYWSKTVQIDVVGLRRDGWTDLGECKWGAVRSPRRLEKELAEKSAMFPNRRNATLCRHVFLRAGRTAGTAEDSPVRWHGLEDLYAES